MHHQLGGSTEDDMNKMSVFGHFFLPKIISSSVKNCESSRPLLACFSPRMSQLLPKSW